MRARSILRIFLEVWRSEPCKFDARRKNMLMALVRCLFWRGAEPMACRDFQVSTKRDEIRPAIECGDSNDVQVWLRLGDCVSNETRA